MSRVLGPFRQRHIHAGYCRLFIKQYSKAEITKHPWRFIVTEINKKHINFKKLGLAKLWFGSDLFWYKESNLLSAIGTVAHKAMENGKEFKSIGLNREIFVSYSHAKWKFSFGRTFQTSWKQNIESLKCKF